MIWFGKRKGRHSKIFKKNFSIRKNNVTFYINSKNNVYKIGDGLL